MATSMVMMMTRGMVMVGDMDMDMIVAMMTSLRGTFSSLLFTCRRPWPVGAVSRGAYFESGDDNVLAEFSVSAEKHCASN